MKVTMIKNFLIISCIGKNDKLGLRINKDFFIHKFENKKNDYLVSEIYDFINTHDIKLDNRFSVIVNQGPGSFSSIRASLAVAKGLVVSKNVTLYSYNSLKLRVFDLKNIERLIDQNLYEKKLIKPLYLS